MEHNDPDKQTDEQEKLNRQLERGSLFTHSGLTSLAGRINESESFLYALIDQLVQKGILQPDALTAAVQEVRKELLDKQEVAHPGLALRVDEAGADEFIPVNCAERWPVCQAVCCKLDFALSAEEVEEGKVKWDMGRPYFIRHEKHGFCTHLNTETKACGVYHDRPAVCKKYSCARDTRIWSDFDNMVLNREWIDAHLLESKPRMVDASMFSDQKIAFKK